LHNLCRTEQRSVGIRATGLCSLFWKSQTKKNCSSLFWICAERQESEDTNYRTNLRKKKKKVQWGRNQNSKTMVVSPMKIWIQKHKTSMEILNKITNNISSTTKRWIQIHCQWRLRSEKNYSGLPSRVTDFMSPSSMRDHGWS